MRFVWSLLMTLPAAGLLFAPVDIVAAEALRPTLSVAVVPVEGHFGKIYSLAVFPDGQRFLTASNDATVKEWDVATGRVLHSFPADKYRAYAVAISPDGASFATGEDLVVKLWDAKTGSLLRVSRDVHDYVNALAFSADGATLAATSGHNILLWNTRSGEQLDTLVVTKTANTFVDGVTFSPDSSLLAVSGLLDGDNVEIWSVKERRRLRELPATHYSAAFSPDGMRLVTGSRDGTLKLWDVASGNLLQTLSGHKTSATPPPQVRVVAFSPSGDRIVSCGEDRSIEVWNAATGELLHTFADVATSVVFLPDGTRILSARAGETKLWDAQSGKLLRTYKKSVPKVTALAASADGSQIAAGHANGRMHLWDARTGVLAKDIETNSANFDIAAVVYSPDSAIVAAAGKGVSLWNSRTGELVTRHFAPGTEGRYLETGSVRSVDYAHDGKRLAFGRRSRWCPPNPMNTYMNFYDCYSWANENELEIFASTGNTLKTLKVEAGNDSLAAFSADDQSVWFAGKDALIRRWDIASGDVVQTLEGHKGRITSIALSRDRTLLLSGSRDGEVKLWDAATGTLRGETTTDGDVLSVGLSADGTRLFYVTRDDWMSIRDQNFKYVQYITQPDGISAAAYTSDGTRVIVANKSGKLTLWDVRSGTVVASFFDFGDGAWMSLTPEGYFEGSFDLEALPATSRGLEPLRDPAIYKALHRPDLLRDAIAAPSKK